MTDDSAEFQLWERARQNDGEAFGRLFDLHRHRVYRRALGLVDSQHDAEDITAAAFFELWRKRHSVTPANGSVLPWLLVTALNLSRNLRRSTTRYQRFLRTAPRSTADDGPDAERMETRSRLEDSLRELSSIDSALLVLTVLEGIPLAEAAEVVGLKPSTARVRLHRARARLRLDLHDLDPAPFQIEGNS
ncbi:RNA polymerase sigma factor [Frondihabitans sp. PAMC 28766]|uniref:RNA polymerase sigma factor n=1 Tax=Frondihabitans sp. PAMC 28766 TaxID=1795630 RepID=UPI001EF53E33|nr:sigma-70 family RNA polymerase sigma factor [Frondihabitans sp. PAMC 28766]